MFAASTSQSSPVSTLAPARGVYEVELAAQLPELCVDRTAANEAPRRVLVLARLHGCPMATVELDAGEPAPARRLAERIWSVGQDRIARHMRDDGLPVPDALTANGLESIADPLCQVERRRFLTAAPSISVVIPTLGRATALRACLDSVVACDYPRFEVIVVENGSSTPATRKVISGYESSCPVRYAWEPRPGSPAARNRGADLATGEIVAFTDDDVVVDRNWLAELARGFTRSPSVACVTGLIVPRELATPAQAWFEEFGGFGKGFSSRVFDLHQHRSDSPVYPYNTGGFGSGNNVAFDKAAFEELGGYDTTLGNGTPALSGEDAELFLRSVLRGYQVVYEPAALVRHAHRAEYDALCRQIFSYGAGQTAVLTRSLLAHPRIIPDFLGRIPAGVRFALDPQSQLNARKRPDYPPALTRLYHLGLLYGPLAYARSWLWSRWNGRSQQAGS